MISRASRGRSWGFTITGFKHRACRLDLMTFAWVFDTTVTTAEMEAREGEGQVDP